MITQRRYGRLRSRPFFSNSFCCIGTWRRPLLSFKCKFSKKLCSIVVSHRVIHSTPGARPKFSCCANMCTNLWLISLQCLNKIIGLYNVILLLIHIVNNALSFGRVCSRRNRRFASIIWSIAIHVLLIKGIIYCSQITPVAHFCDSPQSI
jgi:hypothetical protein